MSEAVTRTQANRVMGIGTSLGDDKLLLAEMRGTEALGRLFEFELDLLSEGPLVDFSKILGQNVTIRLNKIDGSKRYFNGFISRFSYLGAEPRNPDATLICHYRATLVPQAWFLTRVANCRIYQDKAVPDILKDVLAGFTVTYQLSGKYRKWDYCVQYRETDFNFICRLMENEGIHFYFTHDDGKHTMVICDSNDSHAAADGYDDLHYYEPDLKSGHDAFIWGWEIEHEVTSTKYVLKDYNMTTPKTDLLRTKEIEHKHDPAKYEVFDYPGAYPTGDDGVNYTNVRMQEVEAQYVTVSATSSARGIYVGAVFKLQEHPELDAEDYLVTEASYKMRNNDYALPSGRHSGGAYYQAELTCIPKTYQFRTPRLTPKPVVQGPQTAVIVGPSGEEIYTDKYSRVKVQFYWDRLGQMDEKSSCWIRVSQPVAGKKYGDVNIPRIGHEVIVDFLEGDPDQPIITGRVYNADNMPPYDLPGQKMVRGSKTNSTPGGGGSNEMSMDDTKGTEKVTIHAQFDMSTTVEHDQTDVVHNNRTTTVDVDDTETVTGKQTISVTGDQAITLKANQTEAITSKQTVTIGSDQSISVGGKRTLNVTGDETVGIGGKRTVSISGNDTLGVGATLAITANDEISLTTGSSTVDLKSGGTIKISGGTSIELSVGGSSIKISASGIEIVSSATVKVTGATVNVNS